MSFVSDISTRTSNSAESRESFFFSRVCGLKSVHTKKTKLSCRECVGYGGICIIYMGLT